MAAVRQVRRTVAVLALGSVLIVPATIVLPPVLLPDAPAPAGIASHVAAARARLWGHAFRLPLPLHLRFIGARCRGDGGAVLLFEQFEPPYLSRRFAWVIVLRGQVGGGGYSLADLEGDPEIGAFLGSAEVPCR